MTESFDPYAETKEDVEIERLVDSGKFSYGEARAIVRGESQSAGSALKDARTVAREQALEVNADLYHLTGEPTPEETEAAADAIGGEGYLAAQEAATKAFEVSIGDPTVAAAILRARTQRIAEARPAANPDRTQVQ